MEERGWNGRQEKDLQEQVSSTSEWDTVRKVKEHERRKRQKGKQGGGRGQDRYLDSKVDLEEKDSAAKEMSDCVDVQGSSYRIQVPFELFVSKSVCSFVYEFFLPKVEQAVVQYQAEMHHFVYLLFVPLVFDSATTKKNIKHLRTMT